MEVCYTHSLLLSGWKKRAIAYVQQLPLLLCMGRDLHLWYFHQTHAWRSCTLPRDWKANKAIICLFCLFVDNLFAWKCPMVAIPHPLKADMACNRCCCHKAISVLGAYYTAQNSSRQFTAPLLTSSNFLCPQSHADVCLADAESNCREPGNSRPQAELFIRERVGRNTKRAEPWGGGEGSLNNTQVPKQIRVCRRNHWDFQNIPSLLTELAYPLGKLRQLSQAAVSTGAADSHVDIYLPHSWCRSSFMFSSLAGAILFFASGVKMSLAGPAYSPYPDQRLGFSQPRS